MSSPSPPAAAPSPNSSPPEATPRPRVVRRSSRTGTYVGIAIVVVVLLLVGVGYETHWYGLAPKAAATPGACPTGETISGAGASFLTALMSQWETSYTAATQNKVTYDPDGAGDGITSFTDNDVNFAATDEPLTTTQFDALPGTTLTLPVTGGAVTIVYNLPDFTGPLELTGSQLAAIYLGTITNWDSSTLATNNSGLPNAGIIPVVRADGAGTSYVLTNYLSDDDSTFASTVGISILPDWPSLGADLPVEETGNSNLAKYVAETPDSIGYVDLADAESHNAGEIAAMGNPAKEFVAPTVANTQSAITYWSTHETFPASDANWAGVTFVNSPEAADYPLATLSYFLVLQDPSPTLGYESSLALTQTIIQFLDWTIGPGQSYPAALDYVVPPSALVTQDRAAIQTINYDGASVPACS